MPFVKTHPFIPGAAENPTFLKWLRRTHAWLGVFGAAAGLVFALTAITLSHDNFGIEAEPKVTELTLPVTADAIRSEEAFGSFVKQQLNLYRRT